MGEDMAQLYMRLSRARADGTLTLQELRDGVEKLAHHIREFVPRGARVNVGGRVYEHGEVGIYTIGLVRKMTKDNFTFDTKQRYTNVWLAPLERDFQGPYNSGSRRADDALLLEFLDDYPRVAAGFARQLKRPVATVEQRRRELRKIARTVSPPGGIGI